MVKKRIVLLGPPASGKGTQAELIQAKYQIETPSVGAILREEAAAGTAVGLAAEKFTRDGLLVPNEITIGLVEAWLNKHNGAFVFDGFPRTIRQAEAFERLLNQRSTPVEIVLTFAVDAEAIKDRVSRRLFCAQCGLIVRVGWHVETMDSPCPRCGGVLKKRADDSPEALERRMVEYYEKTEPLLSFYEQRGTLWPIAAQEEPPAVFAKICLALESA